MSYTHPPSSPQPAPAPPPPPPAPPPPGPGGPTGPGRFTGAKKTYEGWQRSRYGIENGDVLMRPRPRTPFVVADMPQKVGLRTHLLTKATTVWRSGSFRKFMAQTRCGVFYRDAVLVMEPPEERELCDKCVFADVPMNCVYRFFDGEGRLLYVGFTKNPLARMSSHKRAPSGRKWWPLVRSATYVEYPTKQEALDAEKKAIADERPLFNIEFTDRSPKRPRFAHRQAIPIDQSP